MTDARRDGHYHRAEYPKRTARGWVHRNGEITSDYIVTQSDEQGRITPAPSTRKAS